VRHPDDSQEAIEHMTRHAHKLVIEGLSHDDATEMAVDHWRRSLKRAQMVCRYEADRRSQGKPTLHVPLFQLARTRR